MTYPIKFLMKWYTANKPVSFNDKSDRNVGNACSIGAFCDNNMPFALLGTVFVVNWANVVEVVFVDDVANNMRWL